MNHARGHGWRHFDVGQVLVAPGTTQRMEATLLILGRRCEESLQIVTPEGVITVKVLEFRNGGIRLGICAPRHFRVVREEVERRASTPASDAIEDMYLDLGGEAGSA